MQSLTQSQIKALLHEFGLRPNKKLGQNFLVDGNMLRAIVSHSGITARDAVLEIGAGAGSLTLELSKVARTVVSLELDAGLIRVLQRVLDGCHNVNLIEGDFLKQDLDDLHKWLGGGSFKVCANLPYYITTPVLVRLLESGLPVSSLTVLVQREFANRLAAAPGTPAYGALSLFAQMRCDIRPLLRVPPTCFYPRPGVESEVIQLTVRQDPLFPETKMQAISHLVRAGFNMRRKTLVNNLLSAYPLSRAQAEDCLKRAQLPPDVRAEQLDINAFARLQQQISAILSDSELYQGI